MTSPGWTITERPGPEGLAELRDDWKRLFDSMPHPGRGHVYEGVVAWVDDFARDPGTFTCLVLSDEDGVRGICPLEMRTERVFGIPVKVLGTPWNLHWNQSDLICADDEAAAEFVPAMIDHLRRSNGGGGLLVLGPLPEHSTVWVGLRGLDPSRFCTHALWFTDIVDCDRTFDEIQSGWSPKFRASLRKARKNLMRLDGVEFVTASTPPDLAVEFESFLRVEASGWKGESGTGTAITLDQHLVDFYRALIEGPGRAGYCEFDAIYAEGECIASQFCMKAGEEFTSLKIGYDEAYARQAPGQVLQEYVIARCWPIPTSGGSTS